MDKLAKCCDRGEVWNGEPQGSETRMAGVDVYFSEPEAQGQEACGPMRAIVLVTDVFGYRARNIRLLADAFSKAGFIAVVPDTFAGEPLDLAKVAADKEYMMKWLGRHPIHDEDVELTLNNLVDLMRRQYNCKVVVVEGFCWGGPYALDLAKHSKVEAAAIAHGSGIKVEDLQGIQKPTFWLCAEHDHQITPEMREHIKEAVSKLDFPNEVKLYQGSHHGFAVRGSVGPGGVDFSGKDPATNTAAHDALRDAVQFFNKVAPL